MSTEMHLHELAHHLEPEGGDLAPHGAEFVDRYLTLVEEIIGVAAAFVLRTTLVENGARIG